MRRVVKRTQLVRSCQGEELFRCFDLSLRSGTEGGVVHTERSEPSKRIPKWRLAFKSARNNRRERVVDRGPSLGEIRQ